MKKLSNAYIECKLRAMVIQDEASKCMPLEEMKKRVIEECETRQHQEHCLEKKEKRKIKWRI